MEHLTAVGTPDIMHARVEDRITATEALQTTSRLQTLFKNGHFITVLRKDAATRQATQSTTYDDTLLHRIS